MYLCIVVLSETLSEILSGSVSAFGSQEKLFVRNAEVM